MIAIMQEAIDQLFGDLPSKACNYPAGERIFARGDRVTWLHRVDSGAARLVRYAGDGKPVVLQRAQGGAFLAEASLFSDRYHCDAEAMEATAVRRFAVADVRAAFAADGAAATTWAAYLSREVQRMRIRAEILSLRTVAARLDAWELLHGQPLPAKGQWRVLAEEIGVAPEALYRTLAKRR